MLVCIWQTAWYNAICHTTLGHKIMSETAHSSHVQAMRKEEHWQQVQATMQQHRQKVWRDELLPVPDSWQMLTNGSTTALRSLQMRMPDSRYN